MLHIYYDIVSVCMSCVGVSGKICDGNRFKVLQ